ncbi:DUF4349 domain-containing protein [Peristeroidobacter agariperforans]|uniref:DUF4349 domain-containing protein n=1 Tax=Peristeroidobacter agariperforans TaxID=268404 RepID=UPI001300BE9B|nr:DUF4349 domain-containing protein [Peristeroidobacter agariperforans]
MSHNSALLGFASFILILGLVGCSRKETAELAPVQMAAMTVPAMAPPVQGRRRADTLAYEHVLSIEMGRELLPTRLREIEAACHADSASNCTVLDVALSSNQDLPSGNIRMRLAPGGVEPIVALASKDGEVTSRTTSAEDLAEPVADAERQIALLTLHRDRLTEFMKNKDIKIEQLITVSKELASVQSQLDSTSTQRANLRRRIDTDLLTINLSLPRQDYTSEQTPVRDALRSFGSDFREAVGMVIRFFAVLVPWLVVILPGLFLLRLFWQWIGRRLARRQQAV